MAPRALFRNKGIQLAAAGVLLLLCIGLSPKPRVDFKNINGLDGRLRQHEGVLYYRGAPFTGKIYLLYPNCDTAKITLYANGREDGMQKSWYPNGKPNELRYFENGKKAGVHRGWWPGGQIKFEYYFENGDYEGEVKEWYENGKPYRFFHYHHGQECGLEQMWWDDGAIRANYVVKDGEPYGLIGRKLCQGLVKGER